MNSLQVYFAHPCFTEEQERFKYAFLERLNARLKTMSLADSIQIKDPFLYAPNVEGDSATKVELSSSVKEACIGLLGGCDLFVALVDFDDAGVAFEAGYAYSRHIPIILISNTSCDNANAMLIGAAMARIDRILDEGQMEKLVKMLESLPILLNTASRAC